VFTQFQTLGNGFHVPVAASTKRIAAPNTANVFHLDTRTR
jgi:hypothetical protein